MIHLYIYKFNEEKEYDLDYKKLSQEVIDYVLPMNEIKRDLSIFSYYQLIKLLKEEYHIDKVELNFENKPRLVGDKYYFNIAHTDGMIVIAIADQEVGVDVEYKKRKIRADLYKKVLSETEKLIYLRKNEMSTYFLTCWVKKEAYLKYLGTGIDRHLDEIDTESLSFVELIEEGDYVIGLCSKAKDLEIIHKSV